MSRSRSSRGLDLAAGTLAGLGLAGAGLWMAAVGIGLSEEALTSIVGGWVERSGATLILPGWVRVAIGVGTAAAGGVILWGVSHEAARRRGDGASASPSARERSIAGLALGVGVGAFFSLVGGILVLVSSGVIATEGGAEPELPWFMGLVGGVVALAALLVGYSSTYQWMGGAAADRHRRER